MKPSTLILLLFLTNPTSSTYTPNALEYVLRSIEFEASVECGILSLVLYDIAPEYPFDNILNAIIQSTRLEQVVKYVINGTYNDNLKNLPWHPSMLLIHPGNDVAHLSRPEINHDIKKVLKLFNPTAKTLVCVDFSNENVTSQIFGQISDVGFVSVVLIDTVSMRADQWNPVRGMIWPKAPFPMYLFTWLRRSMSGVNITYFGDEPIGEWHWNVFWMKEVARYLGTEASEYLHHCELFFGEALHKCMAQQVHELEKVDIRLQFVEMLEDPEREFDVAVTGMPLITSIAIPRDRPLNVAELMLMPFSWNVWFLLMSVLVLIELLKKLSPNLISNDPSLLVVCGFERRSLHNADSFERIVLLSIIILMFFVSNAFETKMLSMMVSKPAIQRIKTLSDLFKSEIIFYQDLEAHPYIANQTIFGKLLVQGDLNMFDTVSGVGIMVDHKVADMLALTAFDYERMQPWYVILKGEYQIGFEVYHTSWRNLHLEVFRYVYNRLIESGLMDFYEQRVKDAWRFIWIGRRNRITIDSKVDLNFLDFQPAWVILGIGICVSMVAFLVEYVRFIFEKSKK